MFATYREVRRLVRERKEDRAEIKSLRQENERLRNLLLERDFLFVDRFLTSKVNTFAISDEAQHKAAVDEADQKDELKFFLQQKKTELYQEARDAGATIVEADARYKILEPSLIEDFQAMNGFQ